MIKGNPWGKASDNEPKFYTWSGKLKLTAPEDILIKILLPIIKFAASVGGVGRGWRRPLHIFMMRNNNRHQAAARGSHLILKHQFQNPTTNQIKLVPFRLLPKNPEPWRQTYNAWLEAAENIWSDRINTTVNNQLTAEVLSPSTCAVYAVPGAGEEPIDKPSLTWQFTEHLSTRGDGMNLIYHHKYKKKEDVGGSTSHCSWVSIRLVNIPHLKKKTDTQEIVCLFLGGKNQLRSQFLEDLANLPGAVHLFGV